MDDSNLAGQRRMRRQLTFWRVAFVVLIIAGAGLAWIAGRSGQAAGPAAPHIARIAITGLIQDDRELLDRIDRIGRTDAAKGLIVTISSPGGTAFGGEAIYKAIRKVAAKKPVVSDIRTLAASAGYMIALAGDHIVAGDTSITGSVGVIFQYPQVQPLLEKLGVSLEEIKSTPLKAEPTPFHPPSAEARAVIQAMIDDSYAWFVDLVAERRKMPRQEALKVGDGRIMTGRQALTAKLIDELGGDEAVKAYFKSRNVDPTLTIVDWEAPSKGFLGLGATATARAALEALLPGLSGLESVAREKLFLDGLVSVWQFDPR
ncbi:Clp protease [Rhizobium rhizosphaerae]|uniref:Clp protease n=1 Tax=Xaviernesmea rhizosphaerae TaxID=1672749 RepID=A0ABX3P961_9HYPH|nr:signal peptide peptidase SppA [Xaviernesmea rhizosphaerae]OQP84893.1 Clp protease [Xaviernesmea rhizosphaerae]